MGTYPQYGILPKFGLVHVDQFSNGILGQCVVGMEQLEHVRILSNDFTVGSAPLARRARGSEALRKEGSNCAFQKSSPIL
jgi:hypothetical protein